MNSMIPAVLVLTFFVGQAPAQPPAPVPAPSASCPEMATALQALMRSDVRMRDWPDLARYRDANRSLAPAADAEPRVVFMGDSITDAWQQAQFGFFSNPQYIDRGISGQTTPQMLVRFRSDVIALNPKVVVILAGTNDIAGNTGPMTDEEIEGNLASMAELAHAHGIKVVLASIMPTAAYHTRPGGTPQTTLRPMARIRALNDWIRTYAAGHGDVYLDYFSAMLDASGVMKEELTRDDLHPNAAGYAVMGPLAEAAIRRALR
ncbi:MAG TPA: SGNH/GDSL hydrolase family protein [Vicinamibacterales bacterium]|nr:SGNH/GDSL hydrolase family protein [Vicinamibacterales bacterium]